MIDELRALHAPNQDRWPRCEGCDFEGYESEPPSWPCRTAELVYTQEEIDDSLWASEMLAKWTQDWDYRKQMLKPWQPRNPLYAAYDRYITDALRMTPLLRAFTRTVTKTAAIIQVSPEMLREP